LRNGTNVGIKKNPPSAGIFLDKIGVLEYIEATMQTVQILNLTKGAVIAQEAQLATSLGQRIKGLLGKRSLSADEALILKPCSSIHTFFMHFAIDVLFLDKNMRIIRLTQNMSPSRLSPIVWASCMVIELPAGKISQINTHVGDRVEFK